MGHWRKLQGTIADLFQFGLTGPLLKPSASNVLDLRDADDAVFARLRAGVPLADDEVATAGWHETADTLTHWLTENSFEELTYTSGRVTNTTVWQTASKLVKVRESKLTYTAGQVTQTVDIQYDGAGVELYRLTATYTYSGAQLQDVTTVRS